MNKGKVETFQGITQNASNAFVKKIFRLKVGSCAKIERGVSRIALGDNDVAVPFGR